VRTVTTLYVILIVAGLAYCVTLGVLQR